MRAVEHSGRTVRFAESPRDWDWVASAARAAAGRGEAIGFDTEFHSCDPSEESCCRRAVVHVWSLATFASDRVTARGYRPAAGVTLPAEALHHPPLVDLLEDPGVPKAAHNSPVDAHAAEGAGVRVRGLVNTISLARWMVPGRRSYGLKALGEDVLGRWVLGKYKELFREERWREVRRRVCACGAAGCRRRVLPDHAKLEEVRRDPAGWAEVPLALIVPGHPLRALLEVYAAEDAEMSLELLDWLGRRNTLVPMPW